MPLFITTHETARCAEMRYAIEPSLSAEGNEGRTVDAQIMRFIQESIERRMPTSVDDQTPVYRHVPFETVGTFRVSYAPAAPLLPRKFDFDDEDE